MFYAASEIIFWILLSAVVGGGIGYGVSETRSLRLGKRLNDGKAHAPMERELAIAWDTIEDLNRRLQVAHQTIRGGDAELEDAELDDEPKPVRDAPAGDDGTVGARLSERVASASVGNLSAKSEVTD